MAILVTGGAGYIGSQMVLALLAAGETPVVLDNLATGFAEAVPDEAVLVVGDIADGDTVRAIIRDHRVDTVIHFAGSLLVADSVVDPLNYYQNNTAATIGLIQTAINAGVDKFVFSSTAAVYGAPLDNPIREEAPARPVSPYGSSKAMSEAVLVDCEKAYGLRSVSLRYFNVAGADPSTLNGPRTSDPTHLIRVACQVALGYRPLISVFGTDYPTPDGTCIRDYIHVSDLVGAHMSALAYLRQGAKSIALNCGYGRGYSVLDVIDAVRRISGRDLPVQFSQRRPGDPPILIADVTQIRDVLGWEPQFANLDVIVSHALAWEKARSACP